MKADGQTDLFVSKHVLNHNIAPECGEEVLQVEQSFVRIFPLPDVIDEEKVASAALNRELEPMARL